jgi:hypothetical protein
VKTCAMITKVDPESDRDFVCGKPAIRLIGGTSEGCCFDCFEAMATGGDFASDEADKLYPLIEKESS